MADYDSGEITERERLAAERQKEIARFNRDSVMNQLSMQLGGYDQANQQNRKLADVQLKQNQRKNEVDRFEAQRNLRNASLGLLGSMGNTALNSSSTGNLMAMLRDRNDADNMNYWNQLQANQNAVNNAYQESENQNQVAKNDTITNAAKAIRDIESDLAANLSNINPNLYVTPGTGDAMLNAWWQGGPYDQRVGNTNPQLSGYIMPDTSVQTARQSGAPAQEPIPRNRIQRNDYFGRLVNGFNRRYL